MEQKSTLTKIAICLVVAALSLTVSSHAAKEQESWGVHDMNRPLPPVIKPPAQLGQPPSDAIILFDGKNMAEWQTDKGEEPKWKIENGYMEIVKKGGSIRTKKSFGNCQLHIEWASPVPPTGTSQGRGNSGVFFMSRYELQVLDSYTEKNYEDNRTYADGQAAALYGQYPPLVNVSRKPGEWQSYDVSFLRPEFDNDGNLVRPARITVLHNGVVVHNNVAIKGATAHKQQAKYSRHEDKLPLSLQDHGNPIRFRNIWVRELPEQ